MTQPGDEHPRTRQAADGSEMATVLLGLAHRLQLPALRAHHSRAPVLALFALINGVIAIGVMAAAAVITGAPFIFPSLGGPSPPDTALPHAAPHTLAFRSILYFDCPQRSAGGVGGGSSLITRGNSGSRRS
jgi:hypothetical protein